MGAKCQQRDTGQNQSFNPRTRDGCEYCTREQIEQYSFQSTHPWWVRSSNQRLRFQPWCFNPRTRDGCEPVAISSDTDAKGFNPRTRDGCEGVHRQSQGRHSVSIHAPVMGAKRWLLLTRTAAKFQSTHPWWVRKARKVRTRRVSSFNPRTRDGCEQKGDTWVNKLDVSIHAPVMGANRCDWCGYWINWCFNPRTRDGCEDVANAIQNLNIVSIHAPVMGAKFRVQRTRQYS